MFIKEIREVNNQKYYVLSPVDDNSLTISVLFDNANNLLRNIISKEESAIVSGEISVALAVFISNAEIYLKGNLDKISKQIDDICDRFLIDINNADSYLF